MVRINHKGSSLIELIIYIGVMGMVLTAFINFGLSVSDSRAKTLVVHEVDSNARFALDVMARTIRSADDVVSPTEGNVDTTLDLDMPNTVDNSVFSVSGGVLSLTVGAGAAQTLTSSNVEVTSLQFTNVTEVGGKENVLIQLTLAYRYHDSVAYTYSHSFETSVTLRK